MITVLDCIERIPKSLKGIRDSYPERTKNIADYLSGRGIKKVGRLVFIASGSSYNSAHTAKLFIKNQCGIETEFKYPNIFVHYEADTELSREAKDLESTVYVVISQGGETRLVYQALEKIRNAAGKEHLVLDLSCRKKDGNYYIVTDRWQKFTEEIVTLELMEKLGSYCDEFLVHAVDVEGKAHGVETELAELLGQYTAHPVTYAGGVGSMADIEELRRAGQGRLDVTVGSALDIFGGTIPFEKAADIS